MKKFEYATVIFDASKLFGNPKLNHEEFHRKLNEYGAEGWELVNVFDLNRHEGATTEVTAIFKRAID